MQFHIDSLDATCSKQVPDTVRQSSVEDGFTSYFCIDMHDIEDEEYLANSKAEENFLHFL